MFKSSCLTYIDEKDIQKLKLVEQNKNHNVTIVNKNILDKELNFLSMDLIIFNKTYLICIF